MRSNQGKRNTSRYIYVLYHAPELIHMKLYFCPTVLIFFHLFQLIHLNEWSDRDDYLTYLVTVLIKNEIFEGICLTCQDLYANLHKCTKPKEVNFNVCRYVIRKTYYVLTSQQIHLKLCFREPPNSETIFDLLRIVLQLPWKFEYWKLVLSHDNVISIVASKSLHWKIVFFSTKTEV